MARTNPDYSKLLQEYAEICLKYETKPLMSILNVYSNMLGEEEQRFIADHYMLFYEVGEAARAKDSILRVPQ